MNKNVIGTLFILALSSSASFAVDNILNETHPQHSSPIYQNQIIIIEGDINQNPPVKKIDEKKFSQIEFNDVGCYDQSGILKALNGDEKAANALIKKVFSLLSNNGNEFFSATDLYLKLRSIALFEEPNTSIFDGIEFYDNIKHTRTLNNSLDLLFNFGKSLRHATSITIIDDMADDIYYPSPLTCWQPQLLEVSETLLKICLGTATESKQSNGYITLINNNIQSSRDHRKQATLEIRKAKQAKLEEARIKEEQKRQEEALEQQRLEQDRKILEKNEQEKQKKLIKAINKQDDVKELQKKIRRKENFINTNKNKIKLTQLNEAQNELGKLQQELEQLRRKKQQNINQETKKPNNTKILSNNNSYNPNTHKKQNKKNKKN